MKTKNLFKPKSYVHALSKDKIDAEPLFWLLGLAILTFVIGMFVFAGGGVNLIKTTFAPLNQINGSDRLTAWFSVITDMVFMAVLYLVIYTALLTITNYIVQKVLKLFKKNISLWKLINIAIYTLLIYKFLVFIQTLILVAIAPWLETVSENQTLFFTSLPLIIFNLATLVLYCYGIAWTTKNKFVPFQ